MAHSRTRSTRLGAVEDLAGAGAEQALGELGAGQGRLARRPPRPGRGSTRCRRGGRRRRRSRCRSPSTPSAWTPIGVAQVASEQRDDGALGGQLDAAPRSSPIAAAAPPRLLVAGPGLEHQRALAGRRGHRLGRDREGDLVLAPQPAQPGGGEHDRVELALGELAQPGVDVAVQLARPAGRAGRRAAARGAAGSRCRPGRPRRPRRASRRRRSRHRPASSRGGTAAIASPSGSSAGRSLAEWTPMSASPVEQRPLDPAHEARLVARLAVGGDLDQLGPAQHLGDLPAWARASALPRVAIRIIGRACGPRTDPGRGGTSCTFSRLPSSVSHELSSKKLSGTPAGIGSAQLGHVRPLPRPPARSRRRARTARAGR